MDLISGNKITVTKLRNGYFVGTMNGTVVEVDETKNKVKVRTWQNGERWYSKNNVSKRN